VAASERVAAGMAPGPNARTGAHFLTIGGRRVAFEPAGFGPQAAALPPSVSDAYRPAYSRMGHGAVPHPFLVQIGGTEGAPCGDGPSLNTKNAYTYYRYTS
jgi:hypothetical protein